MLTVLDLPVPVVPTTITHSSLSSWLALGLGLGEALLSWKGSRSYFIINYHITQPSLYY